MSLVCSFDRHQMPKTMVDCTHPAQFCSYNGTDCCRDCYDTASLATRAAWAAYDAETDACPDCKAARHAYFLKGQRNDTIDPSECYGRHIPLLCRNHMTPDEITSGMSWHTKNIAEGRSIFFNGFGKLTECDCSARDLFSPGRFLYKLIYLMGGDTLYTGKDD